MKLIRWLIMTDKQRMIERLFPNSMPKLWCPLLVQYNSSGEFDEPYINAHLTHLSNDLNAIMIAGTNGDGWALSDDELMSLLTIILPTARKHGLSIFIAILKSDYSVALASIKRLLDWLCENANTSDPQQALEYYNIKGIFISNPHDNSQLSQEDMKAGLRPILSLSIPLGFYQIPLITQSEIAANTLAELSQEFNNLLFFKDTSGTDKVICSSEDMHGLIFFRGPDESYPRWLNFGDKPTGPYNGLISGASNSLAKMQLGILGEIAINNMNAAVQQCDAMATMIGEIYELAKTHMPKDTFFIVTYKVIDHFYAYGPNAGKVSCYLYAGKKVSDAMLIKTASVLKRYDSLPDVGYYN